LFLFQDGIVDTEDGDGPLVHKTIAEPFHPTNEWQPVKDGELKADKVDNIH